MYQYRICYTFRCKKNLDAGILTRNNFQMVQNRRKLYACLDIYRQLLQFHMGSDKLCARFTQRGMIYLQYLKLCEYALQCNIFEQVLRTEVLTIKKGNLRKSLYHKFFQQSPCFYFHFDVCLIQIDCLQLFNVLPVVQMVKNETSYVFATAKRQKFKIIQIPDIYDIFYYRRINLCLVQIKFFQTLKITRCQKHN